ncbi:hypothetical protein IAU59_006628 [Kwoniella sp. CBS 9459]
MPVADLDCEHTFFSSSSGSFEWNNGFSVRFGTQYVDYNSPTLERTFKRSAIGMSKFWNTHRGGYCPHNDGNSSKRNFDTNGGGSHAKRWCDY